MSVYGNSVLRENYIVSQPEIVEEAFFMSKPGKELKKKIKSILKEMRNHDKFMDRLKKNLNNKYDTGLQSKIESAVSKLFKECFATHVYDVTEVVSTQYGTTVCHYNQQQFAGIKGEKLYIFYLRYDNIGGALYTMTEKDTDKFKYPEDVVEFALKNNNPSYELLFNKNGLSAIKIGGGTSLAANGDLYNKIEKYLNQKYKDQYSVKMNKITGSFSIKNNKVTTESVLDEVEDLNENCFDDDICLAEYFTIKEEVFNEAAYKALHEIDQDDLAKGGSHLAGLWKKEIENMKSQGKEKMISKYLYTMYYAIVGQSFYTEVPAIRKGENIKYNPKYSQYWSLCKTYMDGKHKAKVLKDVEKTMDAAEQYVEKNDTPENKIMIAYYNAYINDLKNIK